MTLFCDVISHTVLSLSDRLGTGYMRYSISKCWACHYIMTFVKSFNSSFCLIIQKTDNGWREIMVDIDEGDGPHHLRFVLAPGPTVASKVYIKVNITNKADGLINN